MSAVPVVVKLSSILRWTALAALLFTALLRAQSTRARLPYWDLDPTRVQVPETALLYSHGFLLDALVWLAAALAIVGESLIGRRIHWRSGILVLIGAVGVAVHGYILPPPGATPGGPLKGDFMGLALGSAWAAAMVGGWTILHLARDEQMRRAAALALFSFVSILVAKGAYQVYVEHAYTVSAYKKDPAGMLAAQGLTQGSTAAKEYERRLFQAEPIGWFGLSNVYATFVAASFVFFLGLSIGAWKLVKEKAITSGPAGALSLAALASLFGLYLTGSKGGWGAAAAGGVVLLIGFLSRRALTMGEDVTVSVTGEGSGPTRPASIWSFSRLLLPLLLCLSTLAAVTARGLIGERLDELSLLFRWHYLVAATRIFVSESLFGVGPMGFKNAYALHKVPINPEMVESPHSVFFDWAATLGAFGLCWCFVLIWLLLRIGVSLSFPSRKPQAASRSLAPHAHDDAKASSWRSVAPAIVATALASLVAWLREIPIVTPDEWPLRIIALVVCIAFILIGTRIAALAPRAFTTSLAAAASVVAVHSMIEMTPTQPGSCVWAFLVLGVSLGSQSHRFAAVSSRFAILIASVPLVIGLMTVAEPVRSSLAVEKDLRDAADIADSVRRLEALDLVLVDSDEASAFRAEERALLKCRCIDGTAIADEPSVHSQQGLNSRARSCIGEKLRGDVGTHFRTDAARQAIAVRLSGPKLFRTDHPYDGVVFGAFNLSQDLNESVSAVSLSAQTADTVRAFYRRDEYDAIAQRSRLRLTQLDPYSLTPALNAYRLARELGQTETARNMAALALRNNDYLRLDPLKQLDPAQRTELYDFLWSESPNHNQTPPSEPDNPPPPT